MKVFLSWSGARSELVAAALRDWLPLVIDNIDPFISSDIDAGAHWQSEIAAELETTNFGILCVTAENQRAPWLNFEAGALAKAIGASRVIPLAIDLSPAEIQNPLGQFQAQRLSQVGMERIVKSINARSGKPLPDNLIEKRIRKWWPDLDQITRIEQESSLALVPKKQTRADRELPEGAPNTVRSLSKTSEQPSERQDKITNIQRTRDPNTVRRLVDAGAIETGTVLIVRPRSEINADACKIVELWLEKEPKRRLATWINDAKKPLRWHFDGNEYSPSGIVRLIVHEATGMDRSLQGTLWWLDSDGRNLVELAAALPGSKAAL